MPLSFGAEILNEGAFGQVSCIVAEGDEPLSISWSFHGSDITTDLGIITSQVGTRMTMLIIHSVGHRHRGNYTCIAQNPAGMVSQTVELKVNGKFIFFAKALELCTKLFLFIYFRTSRFAALVFWQTYHE
jgi:hypothetical protein